MDILDHMEDMVRYKDWDPTGLDPPGLFLPDHQEWVVAPVSITRDTLECAVERSNYECVLNQCRDVDGLPGDEEIDWDRIREEKGYGAPYEWGGLDEGPEAGQDYKVARFGHWGPGWVEIILAKPGSACHRVLAEAMCGLSDYPVLDETDFSLRDYEWKRHALPEKIKNLKDEKALPGDWQKQMMQNLQEVDHEVVIDGDGEVYWYPESAPQEVAEELGFVEKEEADER